MQPHRGDRIRGCGFILSPLPGLVPLWLIQPTAHAMGYALPALRALSDEFLPLDFSVRPV